MVMTMKFSTGGGGGDFKRLEPGSYAAVVDQLIFMGWQPGSAMFPAPKPKLYVRFQVPGERTDDDKPMVIGSTFTASMNAKAQLRKLIEGIRGAPFSDEEAADFDLTKLLGKPCLISVIETESGGKTYSNIQSASRLPKGMTPPVLEGQTVVYNNTRDSADTAVFRTLPEWLQKKIDAQLAPPSTKKREPELEHAGDFNDEVPF